MKRPLRGPPPTAVPRPGVPAVAQLRRLRRSVVAPAATQAKPNATSNSGTNQRVQNESILACVDAATGDLFTERAISEPDCVLGRLLRCQFSFFGNVGDCTRMGCQTRCVKYGDRLQRCVEQLLQEV